MITLKGRQVEIDIVLAEAEAPILFEDHPDTPALVQVYFVGPDGTRTNERPHVINASELRETELGEVEMAVIQATPLQEGKADYPVAGTHQPPEVPSWPGAAV